MRKLLLLPILASTWVLCAAAATGPDLPTLYKSLRHNLMPSGTLEGSAVTDVRDAGTCKTAFVTASGTTVQDWHRVQNVTEEHEGDTSTIRLVQTGHVPVLKVSRGRQATHVMMSLGVLSLDCGRDK